MLKEPMILIIGAGAAGIAAASRLLERGLQNLIILEAENRIGGRIHTVEFSDNVIELGAQWIHGEQGNVTYNLASPHKLLDSSKNFHDYSKHIFVDAGGRIIPQEQSIKLLTVFHDIYERAPGDLKNDKGSLGEYFTNEYYKALKENPFADESRVEQFLNWMQRYECSIECSDSWFETSAHGITEYWTCEGDLLLNWKDKGYKTIFDLLTKKIPEPCEQLPVLEKVSFNKEVSSIDYTNREEIIVGTKDGTEYKASHVIFTASLGVLKERFATLFVPSLPDIKQRTIKGLNIGTANKIFLEFPHRWWPDESAGFNLIWPEEDKREFLQSFGTDAQWLCDVFAFFTVDYQPRVLCGWIVGPYARHIETLSDAKVLDGLYQLLEKFLGKAYNIPRPDSMLRSKWHSNEHFRGSYSFRSMESERTDVWSKDLAEPIADSAGKPLILFAGEATHEHYYSTVHGAIETGFREADRLVNFHRQKQSHLQPNLQSS